MTKKSNTHPHLQSTTNGLPRMRTHPKTYQQCPETFLFDVSSPLSPICRVCAPDFGSKTRGSDTNSRIPNILQVLQLFTFCLDLEDQCAGLLTNMHLGVKSCNTRQGATAGTAKHFTELPDCPSELRLGWWCTRLVLGHPNALGRCCFFWYPDVLSEWST